MRQLYLAATGQNRGKTTASVGLVDGFRRRGYDTGFIKPVGQRTVIDDGQPADEDAVLMKAIFDLPESVPGHEPRAHPARVHQGVHRRAASSRTSVPGSARRTRPSPDHDMLVIEGTGHAGVGAVIGLSNAVVAQMLGAPAVIVSEGGVGPADRRDRAQRVALRARTACRSRARS